MHNLPAEYVGTDKSVNRAANKRSHEDCMSRSVFALGRVSSFMCHHGTEMGRNAPSELGNSKQYNERSCYLTPSNSSLLTSSNRHDAWVITSCGDRRPAKKVHEGSQRWPRDGQNTENSHTDMHAHAAGFDVNDQSLIPMSLSPTTFVEEENITFKGNCCATMSRDQDQSGKQTSLEFTRLSSRVLVDVTNKFHITGSPGIKKQVEEDDVHRLHQRLKQIEFGRNTLGYERYLELVPKLKRKQKDPKTPNPKQVCSKRSWDGQIRQWRRLLHKYDPPAEDGEELPEDFALHQSNKKDESDELKKVIDSSTPCRPLHLKEITVSGATKGVAKSDAELSIYEDWMDS